VQGRKKIQKLKCINIPSKSTIANTIIYYDMQLYMNSCGWRSMYIFILYILQCDVPTTAENILNCTSPCLWGVHLPLNPPWIPASSVIVFVATCNLKCQEVPLNVCVCVCVCVCFCPVNALAFVENRRIRTDAIWNVKPHVPTVSMVCLESFV
jgi:hypothetical protein